MSEAAAVTGGESGYAMRTSARTANRAYCGHSMRHLLALGPLPWNALGVSSTDWRDCEVHEAFGEYDAIRRLLTRAFDVIVTNPLTPADRDIEIVREARELQPGIRPIVIAPN